MRKTLICAALIGFAVLAGGAGLGAGVAATAPGSATGQRLMATPVGRLILGRIGRRMTLQSELNLTDSQREAIKQTLKSHKQEIARAVEPVVEKKRALRDAVLADKPDDATIRKDATELGSAIGDAAVTLAKVKGELVTKANLTPDQVKKINQFRSENDSAMDQFFKQIEAAQ